MRNTTTNATVAGPSVSDVSNVADRWKHLPFLILMFCSSLPLNYRLEESRPMLEADVAEMTSEATSAANSGSSIWFVLFLMALYFVAGCMVLSKPKTILTMLTRQWPILALLLLVATSVSWSYLPEKVELNVVHNLGALMIALAAALRYRHDPWLFPIHLSYVLGANMLLHIGAIAVIPSMAIDWQGRWQGLSTHPNTLGALAFTTLWANCVILICKKYRWQLPHLLFAALAVAAMLGANSMTSIVTGVFAVTSIFVFWRLRMAGKRRKFYSSVLLIVFLFVATVVIVISQFNFNWLFDLLGRDSNFTGRIEVWKDAIAAISARPLLGWSFDDHAYLIATEGMPYPSYHNGWLDLAVSGGAVSILLFVILLGTWIRDLMRSNRIGSEIFPYAASFGIGYFVHNLTEASILGPRGQMWQIFLVLLLLGACAKKSRTVSHAETAQRAFSPGFPAQI